jgi:hypothetical protein
MEANRPRNVPAVRGRPVTLLTDDVILAMYDVAHEHAADQIRAKIRELLPHLRYTGIIIQQDGATPHTGHDAVNRINQYIQQGNWHCILVNQPPQSPDLNLLDLGLFHGMKSAADAIKGKGRSINTCIERMVLSFTSYPSETIQIVWAVLFDIYRLIRLHGGNNDYKLPHTGIRRRGRVNGNYVDRRVYL